MKIIDIILNTIIVALLLAAVASSKNGKLLDLEYSNISNKTGKVEYSLPSDSLLNKYGGDFSPVDENIWENNFGVHIVYSAPYCKKIIGYAGHTNLYVFIKENKILEITPAPNAETKSFFDNVLRSGLLKSWEGVDINNISSIKPDAISGATLSSSAIIRTVEATMEGIKGGVIPKGISLSSVFTYKTILALIVLALGLFISIFLKTKKWRTAQLVLNVVVLGFWCGQFISMEWLVGWITSGANILLVIVPFCMLLLAIIMPMFNKKAYYCTWVCPFGAAQDLVSKIPTKKHKISPNMMKYLKHLREIILVGIFVLAWLGISFNLIGYEPFSAFIFNKASTVVIVIAVVFLILSLFVNRPWCRFFCPTGQILDWCGASKRKK